MRSPRWSPRFPITAHKGGYVVLAVTTPRTTASFRQSGHIVLASGSKSTLTS